MIKDIINANEKVTLNGKEMSVLRENFPACFRADGSFDITRFSEFLKDKIDISHEGYELKFLGKNYAKMLASLDTETVIVPDEAHNSLPENVNSENIYISGDNLDGLKHLLKSYAGQVKCVYIDPPYNTGTDGFVYNDKFNFTAEDLVEKFSIDDEQAQHILDLTNRGSASHSAWLMFMYPRLQLAKDLLSSDGLIFISIDDNEQSNLKLICDDIFGEENFQGMFIINASPSAIDYGHMAKMHEYALMYSKNSLECLTSQLPDEDKQFKYTDDEGGFNIYPLYNGNIAFNPETRPNLYYPFYVNPNKKLDNDFLEIGLEKKLGWIEVYPVKTQKEGISHVWRWGKEKASKNLNINICAKPMRNGSYMIVEKYRESRMMARSVWWDKNSNTEKGTLLVKALFQGKVFDYPKTVEMSMRICDMGTDKYNNDIVLDFFSGSSTTAHAVMQLNTKDGGNRRFIMVQLPEKTDMESAAYKAGYKNICEIGKERIRRAGELIKKEYQKSNPEKEFTTDIGFKVFKLDSTNIKPWENTNKLHTEQLSYLEEVFKKDRNKEDILYEILLKYGLFDMSVSEVDINGKTMYRVGRRYMLVCLEDNINASDIKEIIELSPRVVVFKETGFNNDNDKINAEYNLKKAGIEEIKCI